MAQADAPPPTPVLEAPAGVRFDFNEGARVSVPARGTGVWRVRLSDTGTGNTLYDSTLAGGMVMSAKKWFFRCRVEVFDGETPVLDHTYDSRGRDVLVRFHIGTLGDLIAWFPYAAAFAAQHGCRLTCCMSALIIPLFRDAYPHIRFVTPAEADDRPYYATYKMMMFFGDRDRQWNTCEGRTLSLQENAAYLLGLPPRELRPMLSLPDESRPIAEPYVCIATQATGQAKYWNNPDGWDQTVAFLKRLGLRVICIDQKPVTAVGHIRNVMPREAEDETGDRPLVERARCHRACRGWPGRQAPRWW
jgi:autotransporter strand-loop-strand O-heptosyltransferase